VKLVIAGSRTVAPTIEDIDRAVESLLRDLWAAAEPVGTSPEFSRYIDEVICGDAAGADFAGAQWAKHHGIPVHHEPVTPADYAEHGRYLAPKMRNRRMAERATHALIFWDGTSGGSADMGMRMLMRRKPAVGVPVRPRVRTAESARRIDKGPCSEHLNTTERS
jgi:hypothetical protein